MLKAILITSLVTVFVALISIVDSEAGGRRSDSSASEFRTSRCKSDSCFSKHPGGTWVHPNYSKEALNAGDQGVGPAEQTDGSILDFRWSGIPLGSRHPPYFRGRRPS